MRQWSPAELKQHLEHAEQPPLLLDVREPWEFDICRLEGAQLIPMGSVPARTDELERERDLVVICHHGVRSAQVCWYLERMGFHNVINLQGGIDAWARQVDPAMAVY